MMHRVCHWEIPFCRSSSMIEMAQTVTEADPPELTPKDDFSVEFHEFVRRCIKI